MYGDPIFQNIEDNLDPVHDRFMNRRAMGLHRRFIGWYRGVVVETNDPLQFRRIRVKVPELHNNDAKTEDIPWAIPAPWMGGANAGSWTHPCIDDIVFVCFEKNHPYTPIWCSAADPTRRRMYSMWSMYTRSPQAVDEEGNPAETPMEPLPDYLPKDGRPMSTGMSDRYGNFLNFSAYGFAPKSHKVDPASVGTDALSKQSYQVNKDQPKDNDPDLKYISMASKYGHTMLFGDIGYQWFNEFKGDFESDKSFEQDRYQYLLKSFNEQKPKDRDQRRIEWRTRMGHFAEMRDVGWDKSRDGEYGPIQTVGDSKDRDERWIKWRTKGGHLFQMIDVGFDPENDLFYKRLNKNEFGDEIDDEEELGEDKRMIRMITRHGNMLILDDRGSDPTDAEGKETPHGNGFLMRTRKGFQMQAVDKPEKDSFMIVTPKDQLFEINDRFQYVAMSTTQSSDLHTEINPKTLRTRTKDPIYVGKTGVTNDPLSNTYHMVLDKQNCMVRVKDPNGAGIEIRADGAPCGEWVETRDKENRALWFSAKDNWTVLRGKKGAKWLLLDDNDDVIVLRNEIGKIQIRAAKNIEVISENGNICFEAPKGEIGFKAKKMAASVGGAGFVWDGSGFGTDRTVQANELRGVNTTAPTPLHPGPLGDGSPSPRKADPCKVDRKEISRKKPDDFDQERGCESNKEQKGPIPGSVIISPPGGGGGGGISGQPPTDPPAPSPTAPTEPGASDPPPPDPIIDPISDALGTSGGGVLYYGTSTKFLDEIMTSGLLLESFVNNLNVPPNDDAERFYLAKTLEVARGKTQATLAQKRYGERALILRIRNVPDADLLATVQGNNDILAYEGNLPFEDNMEIFEEGITVLTTPPLFPNV